MTCYKVFNDWLDFRSDDSRSISSMIVSHSSLSCLSAVFNSTASLQRGEQLAIKPFYTPQVDKLAAPMGWRSWVFVHLRGLPRLANNIHDCPVRHTLVLPAYYQHGSTGMRDCYEQAADFDFELLQGGELDAERQW